MQRRYFIFLASLLPPALLAPRFLSARKRQSPPRNVRDTALRIDELASNIHSQSDARKLIDFLADLFADDLPPAWTTSSLRNRLAHAEYLTATNPEKRIPEDHLAAAWNAYLDTIRAPDDAHVSAAEIHNLRDALYATFRAAWRSGYRNFWAVPSIFATQPDATLASGCRVVECLRILYDLGNMPDSLQATRERIAKGILVSDLYRQAAQRQAAQHQTQQTAQSFAAGRATLTAGVSLRNPVEGAAARYIRDNGLPVFSNAVETMLDSLLNV